MSDVLAERLADKAVMGTDGAEIGTLDNITMDLDSGQLRNLLVAPYEETTDLEFGRDDEGRFRVPVRQVQSVRDYIVVQR